MIPNFRAIGDQGYRISGISLRLFASPEISDGPSGYERQRHRTVQHLKLTICCKNCGQPILERRGRPEYRGAFSDFLQGRTAAPIIGFNLQICGGHRAKR
jgi:hypothetical protein